MSPFDRELVAAWVGVAIVCVVGWWCAYHIGLWIMDWRWG